MKDFDGPWYKRNPKKFIRGVVGMGADLIGCYAVILDLIYEDEGSCPNDPFWIGGILGESSRKTRVLIAGLIERGKLTVNASGRLENATASRVLEGRSKSEPKGARKVHETGAKPPRKVEAPEPQSSENNDLGSTDKTRQDKTRKDKKVVGAKAPMGASAPQAGSASSMALVEKPQTDLALAVEAYNDAAAQCPHKPNSNGNSGWSRCGSLTSSREKALRARLAEVGLEGWRAAVARGAQSDFLSGRAKRQPGRERWGVDLGWLAKAENFTKLLEGRYDNDRGVVRKTGQESARAGLVAFLNEGEEGQPHD